jgi:hypothetical protein
MRQTVLLIRTGGRGRNPQTPIFIPKLGPFFRKTRISSLFLPAGFFCLADRPADPIFARLNSDGTRGTMREFRPCPGDFTHLRPNLTTKDAEPEAGADF